MSFMTPTVVVATGNAHKVAEIQAAADVAGLDYTFRAILDLVPGWPSPAEDGDTFEANAAIKARAGFEVLGLPTLADDSGLMVDALDGAPGVLSARYAGEQGNDVANNEKLLAALAGVSEGERSARFVSCLVLVGLDALLPNAPDYLTASGTCEGQIARTPRGNEGFGYDPLFLPEATPGFTMAELSMAEKNTISHRGHALRNLMELLREY